MFKEERDHTSFDWTMLGNVQLGRPGLGPATDVSVYRLMQFTLRDVLIKEFDVETADRIFYEAGRSAGRAFARHVVGKQENFNDFLAELCEQLKTLGVGILRAEEADMERMTFTLTVAEDLDCSGLPVCDETICTYDEGFISGLLAEQTDQEFVVKEIDCWCNGERVCRFDVRPA